jgi:transcriptional regulator with XRE-family HTH domain
VSKVPDNRLINFGIHVRTLREQLNLSQDQVAANSDKLTKATLSDIENGKRNAAVTTLLDLARGLKIHPRKILDFNFKYDD